VIGLFRKVSKRNGRDNVNRRLLVIPENFEFRISKQKNRKIEKTEYPAIDVLFYLSLLSFAPFTPARFFLGRGKKGVQVLSKFRRRFKFTSVG
jgi:hypothetical protein